MLDPERALWVPGRKLISVPAPRVIKPLFCVGDVVTFGRDPQRFVCMNDGDPTGLGATFAFLHGRRLPLPKLPELCESLRPPAAARWIWEEQQIARAAARRAGGPVDYMALNAGLPPRY